jgi:predicted LPLAT superfamily acyltransferase
MASWDGKSRGTVGGYRIFVFTIRYLGLPATYFLIKFVAFYFYLFAKKEKRVLDEFYDKYLNCDREEVPGLIRKNFNMLGHSIADKVAFLMGRDERFEFTFQGHDILKSLERQGRGAFLISAHLGNWDIAGNMLRTTDLTVPVNVVMFPGEVEAIQQFVENTTGGNRFKVIPILQDLSHIIRIKMALDKGEFVCIHADRFLPGARTFTTNFLEYPARFPLGPFEIATKFQVPICFVYNIKVSNFKYALTCTDPLIHDDDPMDIAKVFVKDLEIRVMKNPGHWFNYHPFFDA